MQESIVIKNLRKTYRMSKKQRQIEGTDNLVKVAVDGISFTTYKGEIFGLLGPNGAGKTTTLRCVATLIKPDSGEIFVEGINVNELKLEKMFTPNYLFDYFSSFYGIDSETAKKRKKFLFEKFGIDRFAEVKIGELSSGMQQKTSLAISLVNDPDVIIFDEPTNGLDVITAKTVTDFLLDLRNQGKSIIISTHIMNLVEKICDRVGFILNGKLVHTDSVRNVLETNPGKDIEDVFFDIYNEVNHEKH
jgi:sodium transport system ATP-binding protein